MQIKKILFIGLFIIMPVIAEEASNTALLPEVKQLLVIPDINEKAMEQNSYVDLITISAPENIDYLAIAKEITLKNNKLLQQAVLRQDSKIIENLVQTDNYYDVKDSFNMGMGYREKYQFPCISLNDFQCVNKVIKDKPLLNDLIQQNKVILMRYNTVLKKPNYINYTATAEFPMPTYGIIFNASQLRLSQAIFYINKGQVEKGLAILQHEVDFAKNKLLASSLIDCMIAIRSLSITYNVIAGLLDNPQLAPYLNDPKLLVLLQPLTEKEQQSLANAFKHEQKFALLMWNFSTPNTIKESIEFSEQWEDALYIRYYREAEKLGYSLQLDKNLAMNSTYQYFESLISKVALTLPEASKQYIADQEQLKPVLTTEQLYKKYEANLLVGIFLERDTYSPYLYRFYDLNNYLWLINIKLKIKQAGISKQQLPEFLVKLGDKAKNPYSQQPFKWDAVKQILSSDWISKEVDTERDGIRASVYIQFD